MPEAQTESTPGKLPGAQKAAILLMLLGEQVASLVFKKLQQHEVRAISAHMTSLRGVEDDLVASVAREFVGEAKRNSAITTEGKEYLQKVFNEAFGAVEGGEFLKQVMSLSSSNAVEALKTLEPSTIADFLRFEHPQTIAFFLSNLPSEVAGAVVKNLRPDYQADVIRRIARLNLIVPGIMDEVGDVLRGQVKSLGGRQFEDVGGVKTAADVVNFLDKATEEKVFEELQSEDPTLADEIRAFMFTFEDLGQIDPRGVQRLLREVANDELTLALKTASDGLKQLFFGNMSERAAQMIKEDLEVMGPVKLSDVEAAQMSIISTARRLEGEGAITIGSKGGGGDVLV